MNPLVLRLRMILTFWLQKSTTTNQICANSLLIFKLKSLLSKNLKKGKNWICGYSATAIQTAHMFLRHVTWVSLRHCILIISIEVDLK